MYLIVNNFSLVVKDFRKALSDYFDLKAISQAEAAETLGITQQAVSGLLSSSGNVRSTTKRKVFDAYPEFERLYNSNDTILNNLKEQEDTTKHIPEGKIINDDDYPEKIVTIIPIKGRGGLENAYYDKIYIDKLKKEKLTIKQPSSNGSEWFKIEVEGVSMDDSTESYEGSKYSLAEGDWAYCRSIPRHNWKNKLHFNSVKAFCFFHNTRGIIFKKVKSHNLETGELVLHSLNPDKEKYPDFTINVAECSYICNVIKVLSDF